MPFRYGIATMTNVPEAFLRVWIEVDGRGHEGVASDCLPPKWFTKDPTKSIDMEVQEMLEVIGVARQHAEGMQGQSLFELWRRLYDAQLKWAAKRDVPALLANFGVSLVERAVIDATCRALDRPFFQLLQAGVFGIVPGDVYPELDGIEEFLPRRPLDRITVRHTVGIGDPLTESDIPASERLRDGLPQSLEAATAHYGLKHFKIKLTGHVAQDIGRLRAIQQVLRGASRASDPRSQFAFSLDGNEQFRSMTEFREFWIQVTGDSELKSFLERLLFVEQPLHRSMALGSELRDQFTTWPERPPIIIDESDGGIGDVRLALDLGYDGASHKNCKGVIKGIANFALIAGRAAGGHVRGRRLIMTGEDLCNVGPVALQQDLAVMATLGVGSVERNGHHYHAGLSQYPRAVQERMLGGHPDQYELTPSGWPTLRIVDGELSLRSTNATPFGSVFSGSDCCMLSTAVTRTPCD
jgi:hypothetical protein